MPIKAHPIGAPGNYRITGTWLDDTPPAGTGDFWREENLRLIGVLTISRVDPTHVFGDEEMWLTLNSTPDGPELRLHFTYAVLDPEQPDRDPNAPSYRHHVPRGLACTHGGETHDVGRGAHVVVPRHVFGVPYDITPCIVAEEQSA